jgi:hypothetical protein
MLRTKAWSREPDKPYFFIGASTEGSTIADSEFPMKKLVQSNLNSTLEQPEFNLSRKHLDGSAKLAGDYSKFFQG